MEKVYIKVGLKHNGELYERHSRNNEVTWRHKTGAYNVRVTSKELKCELETKFLEMGGVFYIAGREITILTKEQVEAGRPKDAYPYIL